MNSNVTWKWPSEIMYIIEINQPLKVLHLILSAFYPFIIFYLPRLHLLKLILLFKNHCYIFCDWTLYFEWVYIVTLLVIMLFAIQGIKFLWSVMDIVVLAIPVIKIYTKSKYIKETIITQVGQKAATPKIFKYFLCIVP